MSPTLDLNGLATFLVVAEGLGFRAAADTLHTSQSVVSQRVHKLEDRLGVRLFHRTTRSVRLTAEGEQLVAVARSSLADIDRVVAALRKEATLQTGRLRLAAVPSISQTILPRLMAEFRGRYPGIGLSLADVDSKRCLDLLSAGDVDLAVVSDLDRRRTMSFDPMFRDECFLVVPRRHPLAKRQTVSLKEIVAYPLMISPLGTTLRAIIDEAFAACGLKHADSQQTWNMATLVRLVEEGFGIGIVPRIALTGLDLSQCAKLGIRERIGRTIGVARMEARSEPPASVAFRALLRERFEPAPVRARPAADRTEPRAPRTR